MKYGSLVFPSSFLLTNLLVARGSHINGCFLPFAITFWEGGGPENVVFSGGNSQTLAMEINFYHFLLDMSV